MTCEKCGGSVTTRKIHEFSADEAIGLSGVTVVGEVSRRMCAKCENDYGLAITDSEGLEAAAALARASVPARLDGEAIRFMRGALGLRSREMANALEVRDETFSRWENDKEPIGPAYEKLLRLMVATRLWDRAPAIECDPVKLMAMNLRESPTERPHFTFHRVKVRVNRTHQPGWDLETEEDVRQRA